MESIRDQLTDRLCIMTMPDGDEKDSTFPEDKFNEVIALALDEYTMSEGLTDINDCLQHAISDYDNIMSDQVKLDEAMDERDI